MLQLEQQLVSALTSHFSNGTLHFETGIFNKLEKFTLSTLKLLLIAVLYQKNLVLILESAATACNSGVERVHIVNEGDSDALITELFTHKGMGILVTKSPTESVRRPNQQIPT